MTKIATIDDIRAIEQTPLSERRLPPNTFAMIQQGASHGLDRPALSFFLQAKDDRFKTAKTYSYGQLLAHIRQTANMLRALGIGEQDVVSLVLPNLPETHFALWGGELAGIVNPINPLLEAEQIKAIMLAAGTRVLITIAPFPDTDIWEKIEQIRAEVPTLKTILRIDLEDHLTGIAPYVIKILTFFKRRRRRIEGQQLLNFNRHRCRFSAEELTFERTVQGNAIASYFHTAGTTGTPKLAVHTHGNEVYDAWAMLQLDILDKPANVFLCGLPLFHVNAVMVTGLVPWTAGGHVILATPQGYRGQGVIANFWKIVEHYRVTFFSAVPTVYSALLEVPVDNHDVSSLEFAICGAAPLPVEVFERFEQLTGIRILEGYGCTEGACTSSVNPPYGERRIGSIGFPLPYQTMKILRLDDDGHYLRDADIDQIGNVAIRGPNVFPGYKEVVHNKNIWIDTGDGQAPFYDTGDLGRMDKDGYCWLTGRQKELIIRGGHNIDPKTIEEPLNRHPDVNLVAAVGRPDPKAGELPVAFVTLRQGASLSEEDLLKFAKDHMTERAAIPRFIHIVDELPKTAVGKIYKPALIQREIKAVYEQTVVNLTAVAAADVTVETHKIHGMLATVQVTAKADADREALRQEVVRELGVYAVKFEVKIN